MTRPAGGACNEIKSNSHQTWTPTHCPRPPKAEGIRCIRRGVAAGDDFGTGTCVCDTEDSVRPGWLRAISGHPAQQLNFTRAGIRPHPPETALKGKGESRRTRFFGPTRPPSVRQHCFGGSGGGAVPNEVKLVVEGRVQGAEKRNGDTLSKISNCQSCRFRLLRRRLPWTSTGAVKPGEVKLLKIPACPPLAFSGVRPGLPSRVKLSC